MDKKRAFIFHLFALFIVLGLLGHALQERTRLMAIPQDSPDVLLDFDEFEWNTTRVWEPHQPPLNISQVTVEHRRLP